MSCEDVMWILRVHIQPLRLVILDNVLAARVYFWSIWLKPHSATLLYGPASCDLCRLWRSDAC